MSGRLSPVSADRPWMAALLDAIPDPALLLDPARVVLATNQSFRDRFTEPGKSRRQHCYELCHHRDSPCDGPVDRCPLQQCLETRERVRALHVHACRGGEIHTGIVMQPLFDSQSEPDSVLEILHPIHSVSARPDPHRLVGRTPQFNTLLQRLERVARSDRPALIVGEPGTQRELVAKTIHEMGSRAQGAFVPLDCQAVKSWQFERELFGHEVGAFPGAATARPGLVGAASGGTLFLHEVETLTPDLQTRLRRLLDSGRYLPEGATHSLPTDFRLLCSTSRDLEALVAAGQFREDLRRLLSCLSVQVPPLRDRLDDLGLLVESLLPRLGCDQPRPQVSSAALDLLRTHDFPGNLRELRHILEIACSRAEGDPILPEHLVLPESLQRGRTEPASLEFNRPVEPLSEVEARYIAWARDQSQCSQRELAVRLGLSERTLYRRLAEFARTADRKAP